MTLGNYDTSREELLQYKQTQLNIKIISEVVTTHCF